MAVDKTTSTNLAQPFKNLFVPERISNYVMCFVLNEISFSVRYCVPSGAFLAGIRFAIFLAQQLAVRQRSALSIVLTVGINIFHTIINRITTSAFFALSEMPVRHCVMSVKLSERLCSPPLEACFYRGCHAAASLKGISSSKLSKFFSASLDAAFCVCAGC